MYAILQRSSKSPCSSGRSRKSCLSSSDLSSRSMKRERTSKSSKSKDMYCRPRIQKKRIQEKSSSVERVLRKKCVAHRNSKTTCQSKTQKYTGSNSVSRSGDYVDASRQDPVPLGRAEASL